MHLGIDLGTTRTVVALADRGNYPVVGFQDSEGDWHDHFPSVSAIAADGTLSHGFAALDAARDGAFLVRSAKRFLASPGTTLESAVELGGHHVVLLELFTGFLGALREALEQASTMPAGEGLDAVVVGVPAHAHTGQRMLTLEAFRRAGFEVAALVNEPSAAGFEFTHRQLRGVNSRRNRVLVYDLGGGTFDASLVDVKQAAHEVLASVGVNRLGGDDVDDALASLALKVAGTSASELSAAARSALLEDCRAAKEALTPHSRRLAVDVDGAMVAVSVADFYDACLPLVQQSLDVMEPLVAGLESASGDVAGIYLVGGSSSLPLVPRVLKERFGRRVHRSPMPGGSTAIGLAIAADPASGFTLSEKLSRGFGVFRERESGREVGFDAILSPEHDTSVTDEVALTRRYRAAHDIGLFRFVEYNRLDEHGHPVGGLSPRGELRFPFDPSLRGLDDLATREIHRLDEGPLVEERYTIDPNGLITVEITDLESGFSLSADLA